MDYAKFGIEFINRGGRPPDDPSGPGGGPGREPDRKFLRLTPIPVGEKSNPDRKSTGLRFEEAVEYLKIRSSFSNGSAVSDDGDARALAARLASLPLEDLMADLPRLVLYFRDTDGAAVEEVLYPILQRAFEESGQRHGAGKNIFDKDQSGAEGMERESAVFPFLSQGVGLSVEDVLSLRETYDKSFEVARGNRGRRGLLTNVRGGLYSAFGVLSRTLFGGTNFKVYHVPLILDEKGRWTLAKDERSAHILESLRRSARGRKNVAAVTDKPGVTETELRRLLADVENVTVLCPDGHRGILERRRLLAAGVREALARVHGLKRTDEVFMEILTPFESVWDMSGLSPLEAAIFGVDSDGRWFRADEALREELKFLRVRSLMA